MAHPPVSTSIIAMAVAPPTTGFPITFIPSTIHCTLTVRRRQFSPRVRRLAMRLPHYICAFGASSRYW